MIFRSFYRLQIVCMGNFRNKSVKIMYYAESGKLWVSYISFINWLQTIDNGKILLTISLEI